MKWGKNVSICLEIVVLPIRKIPIIKLVGEFVNKAGKHTHVNYE
jgi:hypothetical protein